MRQRIIAAARAYLGVPWVHQGRRHDAVDCAGLLVRVVRDVGLPAPELADYAEYPDGVRLLAECERYMQRLPRRAFGEGDVLVLRFGSAPQHFGIVGDYYLGGFSLIHAYRGAQKVVEHRLDDLWRKRIIAAYRLPGVA